ncbi:phage tail protein [Microbulbifer sp. SSSA002]|uniref:phage tail protein n=1 Tax=Microbulbifer sp. SSSA002 TaxID=3243376 RepID=UPI00403928EA
MSTASSAYPLYAVIAEICARAGLPYDKFNTTLLEGYVQGMQITNESAAFEHIQTLAQAYFFDPVNRGGAVTFVPRGAEPVMEIDENDLIGDSDDEKTRRSPEEIVQVLNLNYYDSAGGIDTCKQTSDRSIDTRSEGEKNIETPLVLETDQAAQAVVIMHKVMIEEQRGEVEITLPSSYLSLTAGDVVLYQGDRYRIDEVNIDSGEQKYKLLHDRKSAYQSQALGVAPMAAPDPVPLVAGSTYIEFIDAPILSSGDDTQLGYYIAIAGSNSAWSGATVALSLDGGENYSGSDTTDVEAVMGELTTTLGTHKREIPDTHNRVQVQLYDDGDALEYRTLAQLLNRQNRALIGNEIVSFAEADEISPGVWEIGYLLRGRLGTGIEAHPAGTRFVLLERNTLHYIPTERYNLEQTLTFRATSSGSAVETTTDGTFTGASHSEPAPTSLTAYRSGGQLTIEWVGVGYLGGRAAYDQSQFFSGYRVTINGDSTDTSATRLTIADPGTATIQVSQINSITGTGPAAEITV